MESCKNCNGMEEQERAVVMGVCRVCELEDGDKSEKRTRYCIECKVYICDECRPNIARRLSAAAKQLAGNVTDKVKSVVAAVTARAGRSRKRTGNETSEDFNNEDSDKTKNSA